jgi:predicted glycosyltransferase
MRIWVDCTAAAHPLVLRPIIERFEAQGHEVLITAREYGQTLGILDRLGLHYTAVGEHGGASRLGKVRALGGRSRQLGRLVWKWRPELGLGHGSVDLALVASTLRFPTVTMQDYEWATAQRQIAFRLAARVLAPESIPIERLAKIGAKPKKLVRYPGLKEEYYLADFEPDATVLEELGLDRERVLVVVRPPPETSEYHAPNDVYGATVQRLAAATDSVQAVVVPRTIEQGEAARALRAPNLIVSAGGTMNREAVALGTPVFTTFSGRMGGVDEALIAAGRLQVLEDPAALPLRKREAPVGVLNRRDPGFLAEAVLGALPRPLEAPDRDGE